MKYLSKERKQTIKEIFNVIWTSLAYKLLALIIFISIVSYFINHSDFMRDSTDGEDRSGLKILKDAQSGCEYLTSQYGGLTPRLDSDHEPICNN